MQDNLCADANCGEPLLLVTQTQGLNLPLCRSHYNEFRSRNAPTATMRQYYRHDLSMIADFPGVCYVLDFGFDGPMAGLVKIGYTNNLNQRLAAHRRKYPEPFDVIRVYPGGMATEDYCQKNLLDEKVQYLGEQEMYSYGPELFGVLETLDNAIGPLLPGTVSDAL